MSDADLAEVRRRHGDSNRLGWALQLCGLRMLGFCPDDMTTVSAVAVRFLARQRGVDPGVLASYGVRAQTRTDHLAQVKLYLGFPTATLADLSGSASGWPPRPWRRTGRSCCSTWPAARLYQLRLVRPPILSPVTLTAGRRFDRVGF